MEDFETAWNLFPRKVCKKDARVAWLKLNAGQRFEVIQSLPIHIRYWDAAGTSKEFIPHFSTWLNGERWTDELEMPEMKQDEWWKTQAGIQKKAESLGMWPPRPGEDWHSFKARILEKLKAAA